MEIQQQPSPEAQYRVDRFGAKRACVGFCLLLAIATATHAEQLDTESAAALPAGDPAPNTAPTASGDPDYVFLERQIHLGEREQAQQELGQLVEQIEHTYHRYHQDLVVPLTLLGDAHMLAEDYEEALEIYNRARHISRVSHGLFDPQQVQVVYREAEAMRRMGDLPGSVLQEEYAFEVMQRAHDRTDPDLLPALHRLANVYLQTYNLLAARVLYQRAMEIHEANITHALPVAVPTLQGIAMTYRLERFPPFYVDHANDNRATGPQASLRDSDMETQHMLFNNFPAGERALQQIVEIRQQQDPQDHQATMNALLDLADWHLMFGRSRTANTLYAHVFEKMNEAGEDAAAYFAAPQLLYFPQPEDPRPPPVSKRAEPAKGHVTMQFGIATSGRIRSLDTVDSQPPKLMDFRVRRSMREAVFRPRLVDGVALDTDGQTYTHEFDYFPTIDAIADEEQDTTTTADDADGTDDSAELASEADNS